MTGSVQVPSGADYFAGSASCVFVDSPATASAVTYKIQITGLSGGGLTSFVNRSSRDDSAGYSLRAVSIINVIEVD
jgi:hypothetical protein